VTDAVDGLTPNVSSVDKTCFTATEPTERQPVAIVDRVEFGEFSLEFDEPDGRAEIRSIGRD
jgi:hypothetical protein